MAITYTKQPPTDKLISLNNSIIEFTSSLSSPTYAIITNSENSFEIKIYPSPSGVFWVNLKELYKTFFEMVDNVEINLSHAPYMTFLDDDMLKSVEIGITVYNATINESDDFGINIMRYAAQDLDSYKGLEFQSVSPIQYTCFKGYPFDIQFFNPTETSTALVSRLFDGSNLNVFLAIGLNKLFGEDGSGSGGQVYLIQKGSESITYQTKLVDCEGIYLKWLATDGSWRYWLFNQKHKETINTKSKGQIDKDYSNPDESNNPISEFGKESSKVLKLHAIGLVGYERENIHTIIDAPKVYLYKGVKGTAGTLADWYEVELKTNSMVTKHYDANTFQIDIEIQHRVNTL